jgi:oligopeptide transport system ATP-binding protein
VTGREREAKGHEREPKGHEREPLLRVRGLEKRFPVRSGVFGRTRRWVRAVDGVSFDLAQGETLALVGESGCGKTTTARSILRLVEPEEGEIRFRGRDVRAMGERELRALRRRVQIVFQDPFSSLNPRMTVAETLDEVLRVHRLGGDARGRRTRTAELLDRVGLLPSHAGRYPHEFSGGQRQRIGIARALAVEPELIVCDEPVSALDVSVRAQVVNLLEDLQDELGIAYLLIAHDLALVQHVAHRVAVMYLGRIVEIGPTADLYGRPLHPYTRALLSAVPRAHRDGDRGERATPRPALVGDPPDPASPPGGCPFHPRCPSPARDDSCASLVPRLAGRGNGRRVACTKVESPHEAEP